MKTIPLSRKSTSLSIIDVVTLKAFGIDVENTHDLRENVSYMIFFRASLKEKKIISVIERL